MTCALEDSMMKGVSSTSRRESWEISWEHEAEEGLIGPIIDVGLLGLYVYSKQTLTHNAVHVGASQA